jgi:hypothetical protein
VSPDFKRYMAGVGIGLATLIGVLVAAEFFPLAGLLTFPAFLGVGLWAEGWGIRSLAVIAGVIVTAAIVQQVAG